MNTPRFLPLVFDPENNNFQNLEYINDVAELLYLCRTKLFDDFAYWEYANRVQKTFELVREYSSAFWAVVDPETGALAGVVYLYDWRGGNGLNFSAYASTCFNRKYRGAFARLAARKFIRYVFRKFRLVSLRAEVFARNAQALGFLRSVGFEICGVNRFQTVSQGEIIDTITLCRCGCDTCF